MVPTLQYKSQTNGRHKVTSLLANLHNSCSFRPHTHSTVYTWYAQTYMYIYLIVCKYISRKKKQFTANAVKCCKRYSVVIRVNWTWVQNQSTAVTCNKIFTASTNPLIVWTTADVDIFTIDLFANLIWKLICTRKIGICYSST